MPAGYQGMQDYRVADLHVRDRRANLLDPAGILVPQGVGQLYAGQGRPLALNNMQVCPAQSRAPDPDDHVQGAFDLGFFYLLNL